MENYNIFNLEEDEGQPQPDRAASTIRRDSATEQNTDDNGLEGLSDSDNGDSDFVDDDEESNEEETSQTKKHRSAHHGHTNKGAGRTALRIQAGESASFLLVEDSSTNGHDLRVPGTFGRRNRSTNDAFSAYSRKITAELNTDDELMMNLRDKGFSDQQIADRLIKEGRVRYDRKSITTRIGRIKLAQAKSVDTLLAEGYAEWEFEDDQLLMQAYALADIQVNYEIERARAWRFKKVSEYMRHMNSSSIFSENACRERYQAIMNGTAKIPIALDDDPQARAKELQAFRKERERHREAERIKERVKAVEEQKVRDQAKISVAEKVKASALVRERKEQEKAERSLKRAAQAQARLKRAQDDKIAKEQRLANARAERALEKEREAQRIKNLNPNLAISLKRNVVKEMKKMTYDGSDPRSFLSMSDLKELCKQRNLSAQCNSIAEYVQLLQRADDTFTLQQIKAMCRSKGLNVTGNKLDLKYQLALAEATKFPSYSNDDNKIQA